jgi:hypothetical protein
MPERQTTASLRQWMLGLDADRAALIAKVDSHHYKAAR